MNARVFVLAAAVALSSSCGSCGKPSEPPPPPPTVAPSPPEVSDAGVEAAASGNGPAAELPVSVQGTISFEGNLPRLPPLKRSSDPACAGMPKAEEWVVARDGRLANVVVRVTEQVRSDAPRPTGPVLLSHQACTYSPRVVTLVDGQPLEFQNRDGTLHNVRALAGKRVEFNEPQQPDAAPLRRSLSPGVYTLRCDVHPWAVAYAVVSSHAYLAVSAADGTYAIRGLAPGTYTLETWHERYAPKTATVTVAADGAATADFGFSEKDRQ